MRKGIENFHSYEYRQYYNFFKAEHSFADGRTMNMRHWMNRAIDECIAEGILADFFTRRREKLLEDGYLDFTFERQLELTARDSREEGLERGRSEGLERGRREGQIKAIARICKKHQKGLSIQETSEMLEEDEALVREIYELADKYPDYDAGKLYERYEEEREKMLSV